MKKSLLFLTAVGLVAARAAEPPKLPIVNDTALKIELLASTPDVEACTTVCGAPDGSFYVGNDPRDGRLSNKEPVNTIVRFSSMGADRKRTVFADKIYSPAGSAWHDGYLYVLHDPLLTRFKDTDGDGIADVREDLVTNLGIPPTEGLNDHVVSGFTLGMDGFFYISVGDRGIFEAKSVKDGSTITMRGGGIIRCRTDGTQLEIFSTGTRNHLSVNLDAEDNAFTRDNTDDGNGWWTRLTHHIEGGFYGYPFNFRNAPNYGVVQPSMDTLNAMKQHGGTVDRTATMSDGRKVADVVPATDDAPIQKNESFLPAMADFGGGAPTGGLCYLSDGLPEQYRGRHFFSEWGKAGVFVSEVAREGATFKLVSDTKLIEPEKGGDFRPMQLSVAADGSLLIADWGYGGWKSPRLAGAIWRLSWPEAKIAPRLKDESKASVEELIAALGHPDRDQRLRAQTVLLSKVETGLKAVKTLEAAEAAKKPEDEKELAKAFGGEEVLEKVALVIKDENAPTVQRMHALWTLVYPFGTTPLQPGGLADISRGSSAATTPGTAPTPRSRPGGALEGNADTPGSPAPAGVDANADVKPRVSPGANILQPSGLAATPDARAAIIAMLSGALQSKTPSFRAQAARALGELRAVPALEALVERFRDSTSEVRLAIVTALTRVGYIPGAGLNAAEGLTDSDTWVRFATRRMIQRHGDWGRIAAAMKNPTDPLYEAAWQTASSSFESSLVESFPAFRGCDPATRARAVAALGHIAYQPLPYDGHWWGTQPVKSPPPLNSVPWAGTPAALAALTAALSDPEAEVRLAAATAFSNVILNDSAPESGVMDKNGQPTGSTSAPGVKAVDKMSREGLPTRTGTAPTDSGGTPTSSETPPTHAGGAPTSTGASPTAPSTPPTITGGSPTTSGAASTASGSSPTESGGLPSLSEAVQASRAVLRARLTAEPDRGVRRQLIEALGVQKDPQAMDVFLKIALDEKADAEFRDTAIGAVVNIGGDGAKKVIAQLADAQLSPAATRQIITAAGELKVTEAAPALIAHLKDENAGNREFAARSLQQLGPKSGAGPALIPLLADNDGKTQAAAIEALGSFREKAALPMLIALAEKKRSMKETIGALANMPDESAIPVLVETLRDKNTGVRRNAIKALKTMREKAWPQVEALLASGRVPEELVPEIRNAFESGAITKWKMVGVFENVWEAQHPPEKEALANGGAANLSAKYHNAEGNDVGWIDVTADGTEGRVDLEKTFHTNAMVCAYAFTEIDAPEAADAKLFTSADDEIAVWVNGAQVLNVSGSHGYEPDKNETQLSLRAGKNQLFVKIGNKSGSWVFHARIPGFDNGKFIKSKESAPDEKQRTFALATKPDGSYVNPGNAASGEKIFFDQTGPLGGICATCHAVRGKGGQVGPDLGTIAANYKRPDLITSIHEPRKTIALGFEQFIVETKAGETFAGAIRQDTADAITIVGADLQPHVVKKADVKAKTTVPTSIMPQGLTLGLKPQEFADLLAYLETLNGK